MHSATEQRLRGFYQNLRDKPLEPDDPFYEPFLEEGVSKHDADPIQELKTSIEWNDAARRGLAFLPNTPRMGSRVLTTLSVRSAPSY